MLFADTMAIFFVILGLLITFPSLWLLCTALWPDFVQSNTEAVQKGVLKSFLIGIPVTIASIILIIVMGKLPASIGQIGGILTFSSLMLFAQAGTAGLATHLGRQLKSPADLDRPWKATLRGGIVLSLSYLLPLVGWFLILPGSIIIGAGSSARSIFGRKKIKSLPVESLTAGGSNTRTVESLTASGSSTGTVESLTASGSSTGTASGSQNVELKTATGPTKDGSSVKTDSPIRNI